jgi:hypothetical protein
MSKISQLTEPSRTTGPRLMPDLDISSFIVEASADGPPPGDTDTASAQPWDGSSGWAGGIPRAVS